MDQKPPEKIRAFVALFPSEETRDALAEIQGQWRSEISSQAIHWTRPEQIHLTLNFLGNIQASRLDKFESALQNMAEENAAFPVQVKSVGCFPTVRNPRILWAGMQGDFVSLREIKRQLDAAFMLLGIVPENRPFHPHLTLGRVRQLNRMERQIVSRWMIRDKEVLFGEWRAGKIDFMRSELSASGAIYTVLNSFLLREIL